MTLSSAYAGKLAVAVDYMDDGQMFNGSVNWQTYVGATLVGGALGALGGAFATTTFTASIPTFGFVNLGGIAAIGVTGSVELSISGAQVLTGAGALGLSIMAARIGKSGGYRVDHYYPNDHDPLHVHVMGDDIKSPHGIRVGIDGKPLKGEPSLPKGAKKALEVLWEEIMRVLSSYM